MGRTRLMGIVGLLVAALVAVGVVTAMGGDDGPEAAAASDESDSPSLLGVLSADGGSFEVTGEQVTVRLTGVDPNSTWFTDRPGRNAGTWSTRQVVDRFWAAQAEGPPNVALAVEEADHQEDLVILELEEPIYDEAAGTFEAKGRVLGTPQLQMVAFASRADDSLPTSFGGATMFIDSIVPWVHEWCSIAVTNATGNPLYVAVTNYNDGHQALHGDTTTPVAPGYVRTIWGKADSERDCDLTLDISYHTGAPPPDYNMFDPSTWCAALGPGACDLETAATANVHVPVTGSNSGSCTGGGLECWSQLAESQSAAKQVADQATDLTLTILKDVAKELEQPEIAFGITAFKLVFDYFEKASKNVGALFVIVHE